MTKADVLEGFESFKISDKYKTKDGIIDYFPYEISDELEAIFFEMPAWNKVLKTIKTKKDFPKELNAYINYIEKETGVPITIVSTGPDRVDTVLI